MSGRAYFRFYAELNDFLPRDKRQKLFAYHFFGNPSVKDAIEAIGVPHPEVDLILVNDQSVDFDYRLQNEDRVAVYPVFELLNIAPVTNLRPKPLRQLKFVVDVNLGKLARKLRLLGFDVAYDNNRADHEIIQLAVKEKRVILTRDVGLLKHRQVTHGYWVRSTEPFKQTVEVVCKYDLFNEIQPFSRCMECNEKLESVKKEEILSLLPPKTRQHFDKFYRCPGCGKIYWRGSHYRKMMDFVARIQDFKGNCSSA